MLRSNLSGNRTPGRRPGSPSLFNAIDGPLLISTDIATGTCTVRVGQCASATDAVGGSKRNGWELVGWTAIGIEHARHAAATPQPRRSCSAATPQSRRSHAAVWQQSRHATVGRGLRRTRREASDSKPQDRGVRRADDPEASGGVHISMYHRFGGTERTRLFFC